MALFTRSHVNVASEKQRANKVTIKEQKRDMRFFRFQNSVIEEKAKLIYYHSIIYHDSHWYACRVKEAIHIRLHPKNAIKYNGIEIPEAWKACIKEITA